MRNKRSPCLIPKANSWFLCAGLLCWFWYFLKQLGDFSLHWSSFICIDPTTYCKTISINIFIKQSFDLFAWFKFACTSCHRLVAAFIKTNLAYKLVIIVFDFKIIWFLCLVCYPWFKVLADTSPPNLLVVVHVLSVHEMVCAVCISNFYFFNKSACICVSWVFLLIVGKGNCRISS